MSPSDKDNRGVNVIEVDEGFDMSDTRAYVESQGGQLRSLKAQLGALVLIPGFVLEDTRLEDIEHQLEPMADEQQILASRE